MATYVITGPDGRRYSMSAPDDSPPEVVQQKAMQAKAMLMAESPTAQAQTSSITADDLVRQGLSEATFRFGDELRGAASAALGAATGQGDFSQLYRDARDYERQKQAEFESAHPFAAGAASLAGGLALGIPAGIRLGASRLAQPLAQRVADMGLLKRLGAASGIGATSAGATGLLAGAGQADTIADVPAQAAQEGLTGAFGGWLLGPAFEAGATTVRGLGSILSRARDPNLQAAKNIERATGRAQMTPEETLQRASAMGPTGVLADTSESARSLLDSMTQQPGAARDLAMRQLEERSRRQGSELLAELGPGKKHETLKALQKFRADEASPVYERAYARGVEHNDALESIYEDLQEQVPGIWEAAKKLGKGKLRNEGKNISEEALGDARPSLRGWQAMKETLDDSISSLEAVGKRKQAGVLRDLRSRLLNELDSQNLDYKKARGMWSDSLQFEEQMKAADRFMSATGADFEEMMSGLSKIDREAVRIGAVQAIEDRIERGQWTQDVAKFFRTPAMDRKMRALFNSNRDYADFKNRLVAATEKQRTFDAVRGNSATSRREAARAESNDWIGKAMEATYDVATGSPTSTIRRGVQLAGNALGALKPGASEAAREATARMLLQADPDQRMLDQIYRNLLLQSRVMPPPAAPLSPGLLGGVIGSQGAGLLGR